LFISFKMLALPVITAYLIAFYLFGIMLARLAGDIEVTSGLEAIK